MLTEYMQRHPGLSYSYFIVFYTHIYMIIELTTPLLISECNIFSPIGQIYQTFFFFK